VFKEHIEFVLGHAESHLVGSVDDKDYSFRIRVVLFPERAVLSLATHVEDCEVDLRVFECFQFEADCRCDLLLGVLLWLQPVDHRRLS